MNLHTLKPAKGSVKSNKRVGRGEGSGWGGTAARGMNGAKSRSGYARKKGFEGGQMPIQRRLPKVGFNSRSRKEYKGINLNVLQGLAEKGINAIDLEVMHNAGLTPKNGLVKILGNGELKAKVDVKAHAFSKSAKAAIEAKGGSAVKIDSK